MGAVLHEQGFLSQEEADDFIWDFASLVVAAKNRSEKAGGSQDNIPTS